MAVNYTRDLHEDILERLEMQAVMCNATPSTPPAINILEALALLAEIDRLKAENAQLLDTVAEAWDEGYLDKESEAPEEMIERGLRKRAQNPYRENKGTRQ